jgi:hypothetical protein
MADYKCPPMGRMTLLLRPEPPAGGRLESAPGSLALPPTLPAVTPAALGVELPQPRPPTDLTQPLHGFPAAVPAHLLLFAAL